LFGMNQVELFFRQSVKPLYIDSKIEATGSSVPFDYSSSAKLFHSLHNHYQPFYILLAWYCIATLVYLFIGAIFILIEQMGWLYKYKINKEKNTIEDYWKCFKNLMFNIFIIIPPMLFSGWPFLNNLFFDFTAPVENFPSLTTIVLHIVLCLYIEDIVHYIGHRFLHTRQLYKRIHKIHHEFEVPMALSGNYAHPVETLFLSIATFCPMAIIPNFQLFTFYLWVLIRWVDAALEHCGYDIMPHYLPFHGGITFHDSHHTTFNYNFGSRFTYLDKLLGTYKDPYSKSLTTKNTNSNNKKNTSDNVAKIRLPSPKKTKKN